MKDRDDDDILASGKIHHRIRKPPDDALPNVLVDHRVYFGVAANQLHATIKAANKLYAQAGLSLPVPLVPSTKSASAAGRTMSPAEIIALRREYGF